MTHWIFFLVAACMQGQVPPPGIKPWPPALGAQSLTHWTTREVPKVSCFVSYTLNPSAAKYSSNSEHKARLTTTCQRNCPESQGSSGFRSKFDQMLGGGFVGANLGKCLRSQKRPCFCFGQLTLDSISKVPMLLML